MKIKKKSLDDLGDDFEKTANGYVDYLLLDARGFPIAVLEAKSEKFDPLVGKEQARKYAHSQNVRFVMLSNGNLNYFWDLEQGNPVLLTELPTPEPREHSNTCLPIATFAHDIVQKSLEPDNGAKRKGITLRNEAGTTAAKPPAAESFVSAITRSSRFWNGRIGATS